MEWDITSMKTLKANCAYKKRKCLASSLEFGIREHQSNKFGSKGNLGRCFCIVTLSLVKPKHFVSDIKHNKNFCSKIFVAIAHYN